MKPSIISRLLFGVSAMIAAGGCSTLEAVDPFSNSSAPNYAEQSQSGALLTRRDTASLADAFAVAMASAPGETAQWRGPTASGAVTARRYAIGNLLADPRQPYPAARGDIDLTFALETDLGLHVPIRNTNVRIGPGTEFAVAEVLPSGTGVDVVGRAIQRPWALVAANGVIRGYVYRELLVKAPGTDSLLAGGPQRQPVRCREFEQELRTSTGAERFDGAACLYEDAWALVPPAPEADELDDPLLEY